MTEAEAVEALMAVFPRGFRYKVERTPSEGWRVTAFCGAHRYAVESPCLEESVDVLLSFRREPATLT